MSQCPVCSSPIEESFGLIECPGCHKILFADFDGILKVHDESAEVESDVESESKSESKESSWNLDPEIASESGWDLDRKTHALVNLDPHIEPESVEIESESESQAESQNIEEDIVEDILEEQIEEPKDEMVPTSNEISAETLSTFGTIEEINQFAKSEESSLKQGSLIYNLKIKNIDTEELKREILDVLKENRLNIDVKNLKFALPTLELKDLNPVKVSVIVSRIKHLPIEMEWEQRSIIVDKEDGVD